MTFEPNVVGDTFEFGKCDAIEQMRNGEPFKCSHVDTRNVHISCMHACVGVHSCNRHTQHALILCVHACTHTMLYAHAYKLTTCTFGACITIY